MDRTKVEGVKVEVSARNARNISTTSFFVGQVKFQLHIIQLYHTFLVYEWYYSAGRNSKSSMPAKIRQVKKKSGVTGPQHYLVAHVATLLTQTRKDIWQTSTSFPATVSDGEKMRVVAIVLGDFDRDSRQSENETVSDNRVILPDVIFILNKINFNNWEKNGADSEVKFIRKLWLRASSHVDYGWVASGTNLAKNHWVLATSCRNFCCQSSFFLCSAFWGVSLLQRERERERESHVRR